MFAGIDDRIPLAMRILEENKNVIDALQNSIIQPENENKNNISNVVRYCIFKKSILSQNKQSEQTRNAQGGK
jgi:hypothetical protein